MHPHVRRPFGVPAPLLGRLLVLREASRVSRARSRPSDEPAAAGSTRGATTSATPSAVGPRTSRNTGARGSSSSPSAMAAKAAFTPGIRANSRAFSSRDRERDGTTSANPVGRSTTPGATCSGPRRPDTSWSVGC